MYTKHQNNAVLLLSTFTEFLVYTEFSFGRKAWPSHGLLQGITVLEPTLYFSTVVMTVPSLLI